MNRQQLQLPMARQITATSSSPSSQQLQTSWNEDNLFHSLSKSKTKVRKLIVFDLDYTLWMPELYTLRGTAVQRPVANVHVTLFPVAKAIVPQIR